MVRLSAKALPSDPLPSIPHSISVSSVLSSQMSLLCFWLKSNAFRFLRLEEFVETQNIVVFP